MSKRLGGVNMSNLKPNSGCVVTISRAAGCSTQKLARDLAIQLNGIDKKANWEVISKEVLHESAHKLEMAPEKIKEIFKTKELNIFEDIVQAFVSTDYNLEKKMRDTVVKVIHQFGVEGHKIILGRAGNIICADIENAIHIRIDASLDWRIKRIMSTKNLSKEAAAHFIETTERDRNNFRKSIKGKTVETEDFDIVINQSKFTNEEIIELIVSAIKLKKIV